MVDPDPNGPADHRLRCRLLIGIVGHAGSGRRLVVITGGDQAPPGVRRRREPGDGRLHPAASVGRWRSSQWWSRRWAVRWPWRRPARNLGPPALGLVRSPLLVQKSVASGAWSKDLFRHGVGGTGWSTTCSRYSVVVPGNQSRRNLITAGLGLLAAAIVAGCTKAVQARPSPQTRRADSAAPSDVSGADGPAPTLADSTTAPSRTSATASTITTPAGSTDTLVAVSPRASAGRASTPVRTPTGPARQITHGPRDRPQLSLTFHGAGDIGYARQILAIARAKKAHLTVMAVGTWLSENPRIGREILAGGHDLGNHTLSHLDINSLPPLDMRREVVGCRDILLRTTGNPGSYFRQSQSQTANRRLLRVVGAAGYRLCLSYDLDSLDWTDPGAPAVRENLAAAGARIDRQHAPRSPRHRRSALPAILDDLAAGALHAVTVTTLLDS